MRRLRSNLLAFTSSFAGVGFTIFLIFMFYSFTNNTVGGRNMIREWKKKDIIHHSNFDL
nr:MAG TPA: hypothetical protein [Caudoviricetes sp.]